MTELTVPKELSLISVERTAIVPAETFPELCKSRRQDRKALIRHKRKRRDRCLQASITLLSILMFYWIGILAFLLYCLQAGPIW